MYSVELNGVHVSDDLHTHNNIEYYVRYRSLSCEYCMTPAILFSERTGNLNGAEGVGAVARRATVEIRLLNAFR